MPILRARGVILAVAAVSVPQEITILRNSVDDVANTSEIGHVTENMLHVLPPVSDLVSRVVMPAEGSRRIVLTIAAV